MITWETLAIAGLAITLRDEMTLTAGKTRMDHYILITVKQAVKALLDRLLNAEKVSQT